MAVRAAPRDVAQWTAAALLLFVAGCRGKEATPPLARVSTATAASSGPVKPLCPRTGHWTECLVFARLEQAGVAPQRDGKLPDLPQLGPMPLVYTLGRNAIAVYLFSDTVARARAARGLDTLRFVIPSASLSMRGEATAIQNDNLLALLFSRLDQQRERVSDAFMAGAPQP